MKSYFVGLILLFAAFGILNMGIAAAAGVTAPIGIVSYVPITITSTSAITGNFQQMAHFNPSTYSQYLNANMKNVEFFTAGGAIIPSWLENYTTSNAIYWLNLNGVSNDEVIYMGFAPSTTNLFSISNGIGEAPQLSATYGEYDTGSTVFSYYQSFGSLAALPNGWSNTMAEDPNYGNTILTFNPDNTVVASTNTVVLSPSKGCGCGIYENAAPSMSPGNIIEWYGNMYNVHAAGSIAGVLSQGTTNSYCQYDTPANDPMPLYEFNCNSMLYTFKFKSDAGSSSSTSQLYLFSGTSQTAIANEPNKNMVYSLAITNNGKSFNGLVNYTDYGTQSIAPPLNPVVFTFSPGTNPANGESSTPQTIYWLRTRVMPPNDQMPSLRFGAVTTVPPLTASLTVIPTLAYVGQKVTFIPTATGGRGPYMYNYLVYNAVSGKLLENSIAISPTATGNYLGQVEVTDSNTPRDVAYSANVPFNAIPYNGVIITSNVTAVDLGEQVFLTVNDIGSSVGTLVSPLVGKGNDIFKLYLSNSIAGIHTPIGGVIVRESALPMHFRYTPNTIGDVTYTVGGKMVAPLKYPAVFNSVTITVNADPSVSASDSATSVTTGGTETLTATATGGTPPYSYQWYTISGSTNTLLSGAASRTYTPSISSTGTFTYGVNVIDATGMTAYSGPVSYSVTAHVTTTATTVGPIFTGGLPPTTTVRPTTTIAPVATTSVPTSPTPPPTTTVKAAPTTTVLPTTPTTTGSTLPPPSGITPPSSNGNTRWLILAIIIIILILLALYWYSRRNRKRDGK